MTREDKSHHSYAVTLRLFYKDFILTENFVFNSNNNEIQSVVPVCRCMFFCALVVHDVNPAQTKYK